MQSFTKMSTLVLVMLFSVAAYGSHCHDCFRCTPHNETLKYCTENMMGNYKSSEDHVMKKHSSSPWNYKKDTKDGRVPHLIWVANCDHYNKCQRGHTSEPIKVQILVLMRETCEDGKSFKLSMQTHEIAVGCTCVGSGSAKRKRK